MQNPKVKSKVFRSLLPEILTYKEKGFTPDQIIGLLADKGLNLTIGTYNLYLFRYAKKPNSSNNKNQNMVNSTLTSPKSKYGSKETKTDTDFSFSDSSNLEFGTPEHKAKVQAETEELFRSSQKIGLR